MTFRVFSGRDNHYTTETSEILTLFVHYYTHVYTKYDRFSIYPTIIYRYIYMVS